MKSRIKDVAVKDVEADEIWGFVGMKKMTKLHKENTIPRLAMPTRSWRLSANTKLILTWHLGDRDTVGASLFSFGICLTSYCFESVSFSRRS